MVQGSALRVNPIHAAVITPSDTTGLDDASVLYVGEDGNVAVTTEGGDELTFQGVKAGTILPVSVIKVKATGTTSNNIVAAW